MITLILSQYIVNKKISDWFAQYIALVISLEYFAHYIFLILWFPKSIYLISAQSLLTKAFCKVNKTNLMLMHHVIFATIIDA